MRASPSSSTRRPMDTTLRRPSPDGLDVGRRSCARRRRRPAGGLRRPSMRGTEKPQMSASSTPTVKPLAARAAARLTVTEDLPTPPLPEAMVSTRVVGGIAVVGAFSRTFQRALAMAAAFSSGVSSVQSQLHAGDARDASRSGPGRRVWIWARSGQPAVVRAMVTVTSPSGVDRRPPWPCPDRRCRCPARDR